MKEKLDLEMKSILQQLHSRGCSKEELDLVWDAYLTATKMHEGQTRRSGEPYIIHPVAVATIVAEDMELDSHCVIAALLHDVVEDTDYTIDMVRERYGDDVAFLVDVVTKKGVYKGQSKQVENFKQILGSVQFDIRALMIKLADRLNNMRTLASMPAPKQMKIAGETDFFYAPLAGRLGLYRVKSELENLSFRFRCPREYEQLDQQLAEDKQATKAEVDAFVAQIDEILTSKGFNVHVEIRYRRPYSIWRNMHEEAGDFAKVEFKHYIRVIYEPQEGISEKNMSLLVYSALTDVFRERPGSVVNYIDRPKENGYQSFHVKLLSARGRWEELHISSYRMLHNSCVGFLAQSTHDNKIQWMDKMSAILKEMAEVGTDDFMKGVSTSFYNEDIYVLTPKGKVVILPKGASVLDFAYELHSDIGRHAQYARINGKLSTIKETLQRGDVVEVFTNDSVEPEPDWLKFVKTYKAIRRISAVAKTMYSELDLKYSRCELCKPLPGDEVIGFKTDDGLITVHKRNCPQAVKLASEHGDMIVTVEELKENPAMVFSTKIHVKAIDRPSLLMDILACISGNGLSMTSLETYTKDWIVDCEIEFGIHSYNELVKVTGQISKLQGVEEVMVL